MERRTARATASSASAGRRVCRPTGSRSVPNRPSSGSEAPKRAKCEDNPHKNWIQNNPARRGVLLQVATECELRERELVWKLRRQVTFDKFCRRLRQNVTRQHGGFCDRGIKRKRAVGDERPSVVQRYNSLPRRAGTLHDC